MLNWFGSLDRVLRGEATSEAALASRGFDVPIWGLCVLIDALGLLYGLCMGVFNLASGEHGAWKQTVSCMMKVPALFLLTLLVTLPSLYVFNARVGSRLMFRSMVRLLVAALAVMLAVLSSIGPIVAFFSFTTTSYPFMVLLNVLVFSIAGCLGMKFLLQALHRMTAAQVFNSPLIVPRKMRTVFSPAPTTSAQIPLADADLENQSVPEARSPAPVSLEPIEDPTEQAPIRSVRLIFQIWVLVFSLVGTQMAWVLSPFLGHPHHGFVLFRPTGSNFFLGVWENLNRLMH